MDSGGVFEVTVGATDGDHADLMDSIAPERQLTLQFTDISGWVPDLEFTSQAPSFLAALGLESCWRRPGGKAKPPRQVHRSAASAPSGACTPARAVNNRLQAICDSLGQHSDLVRFNSCLALTDTRPLPTTYRGAAAPDTIVQFCRSSSSYQAPAVLGRCWR